MGFTRPLAFRIAPKSGPLRVMETLLDANRALTADLPPGYLMREHWRLAARGVLQAAHAEPQSRLLVELATELLLHALEREGWMTRPQRR